MSNKTVLFVRALVWLSFVAIPLYATAGMPSVLPEDLQSLTRLTEQAIGRLQAISFFLLAIAVAVVVVQRLWNVIATDLLWLPKLTLGKATILVLLWGTLFIIVLTMISGARELMTPGAWKKEGVTYTLEQNSK